MLVSRRKFIETGVLLASATAVSARTISESSSSDVTKTALCYSSRDGKDLLLDLYRPANATEPLPVVVFVHGGGWEVGTRETAPDLGRYFARDGFAMVSIDYRLVPEFRFPEPVIDVKTSIRWLRANARALGLDRSRIGLWGTSAGGHLAALAALAPPGIFEGTEHLNQSSRVACVVDGYGISWFTGMEADAEAEKPTLQPILEKLRNARPMIAGVEVPGGSPVSSAVPAGMRMVEGGRLVAVSHDSADSAESKFLGAPIQSVPAIAKAASPVTYAKRRAPPFLLMHGLSDGSVPHAQSVRLYEALARSGNDATLRLIDGLPHTFFNRANLDDIAGPFRMTVRHHAKRTGEVTSVERANVFDSVRDFLTLHLK